MRTCDLRRENTNQWERVLAGMSFQWTRTVGPFGKYPGKGLHPDPHFTPPYKPRTVVGPPRHIYQFSVKFITMSQRLSPGNVGCMTLSLRLIVSKVAMCCMFEVHNMCSVNGNPDSYLFSLTLHFTSLFSPQFIIAFLPLLFLN